MGLVRISGVTPLDGFHVRLALTDGAVIERDVEPLLVGPVFEAIRDNPDVFRAATVACGTVVWPNGADLCLDVLIWGGPPREGPVPRTVVLATHARSGDTMACVNSRGPEPAGADIRAATRQWLSNWKRVGPVLDAERWRRLAAMSARRRADMTLDLLSLRRPDLPGDDGEALVRAQRAFALWRKKHA